MKYVRKVAAAVVVVSVLSAGVVYAQAADCKKKCNEIYAACQKAGKDQNKCLAAWVECKKKCTAATAH
ncbi:hypothetical protein PQU92_07590 [Asticcacaulis sp. BYS171W]|uniref:Uncharacterized protein n=1 Tax=Asticcacaulis aquaticus TaxID=2984212 RepID=A0ABT5HTE4_9CAUL|nr:hypothetical protein [Asticcacaulis aquaticus]MDC7683135.1 hypothetical protein [Asticcacaulis aquaticus]